MGRTQALTCITALLLVLVAKHEVQADTTCDRQCPGLCHSKGKSLFQCYLYCIKHCGSGHDGVKLTEEEEKQLKSDNQAMLSEIEAQLIYMPHQELEHDPEKLMALLKKPPQDLNGQGSEKKVQGRKEKDEEYHPEPVINHSSKD